MKNYKVINKLIEQSMKSNTFLKDQNHSRSNEQAINQDKRAFKTFYNDSWSKMFKDEQKYNP